MSAIALTLGSLRSQGRLIENSICDSLGLGGGLLLSIDRLLKQLIAVCRSSRFWSLLSTTASICNYGSEFPKSLLCMEAGTIAGLPRDLTGLGNVEKCNARQTDQARARERHGRCSSRRNRCRLIHLSRNGARYRVYVKGRPLCWRPLSCEP